MIGLLVEIPRWLLLASLVFAPWAYGSTRAWAIEGLSLLLGCVCLFWLIECLARRRRPNLPLLTVLPALGLALQGWWMVLNAHSYFDADLNALLPRTPLLAWAPGSANGPASRLIMLLFTGMLGTFLFSCDLAQDPVWRRRIWVTMGWTGLSIAIFGILQKIGGDAVLDLIWEPGKRDLTSNFATFRYRGNAGAFLNLIFPMVAGLAFLKFQRSDQPWSRAIWSAGLFILILAIQLNPSRAGWGIGLILAFILGAKVFLFYRKRTDRVKSDLAFALMAMLLLGAIGVVSFFGDWQTSWERFGTLGFNLKDRSPTEIYLKMVPDAGAMGFGPGTFSTVFPSYQEMYDFGGRSFPRFWKEGFFEYAHQDYLESLMEWGYFGTFLWATLAVGGMAQALLRYLQRKTSLSLRWLMFCSLLALGGVFAEAWIDFPLQIASIQLYVFVLLGICWGANSSAVKQAEASRATPPEMPRRPIPG